MRKQASILDFQQESLCKDIWLPDNQIRPVVSEFVIKMVNQFFYEEGFTHFSDFIVDLLVGSSLATFFYREDTDFDVKVVLNMALLRRDNSENSLVSGFDDAGILDNLIQTGRKSYWLTNLLPGTYHPLDVYFYSEDEFNTLKLVSYDSLYSFGKNAWIKEPQKLPKGVSKDYVLKRAKDLAKGYMAKLDKDIVTARRDSIDLVMLLDYLKTLDQDTIKDFGVYLRSAYDEVNTSLSILLKDREQVRKLRKDVFHKGELKSELSELMNSINFSDENIIYKLLQRYGYMQLLTELHELYNKKGFSIENIKDFLEILT